ncbi:hypothetical protein FXO38_29373 [Capsicum annuum]|nr:hypothetical protein FXO38_29373 [Capsicum annuum]KAF3643930.1 hypothetical protein FXO37_21698 [Capsicum annuum]
MSATSNAIGLLGFVANNNQGLGEADAIAMYTKSGTGNTSWSCANSVLQLHTRKPTEDLFTGKVKEIDKHYDGLYYLAGHNTTKEQKTNHLNLVVKEDISLWHKRMRHAF